MLNREALRMRTATAVLAGSIGSFATGCSLGAIDPSTYTCTGWHTEQLDGGNGYGAYTDKIDPRHLLDANKLVDTLNQHPGNPGSSNLNRDFEAPDPASCH